MPLIAGLMLLTGWRGMFLICGLLGVAFAALWLWFYRTPRQHKWASQAEVEHIEAGHAHSDKSEQSRR